MISYSTNEDEIQVTPDTKHERDNNYYKNSQYLVSLKLRQENRETTKQVIKLNNARENKHKSRHEKGLNNFYAILLEPNYDLSIKYRNN